MIRYIFILLFIGSVFPCFSQKKYTLSGYIRDMRTGENLIGANVFDKNTFLGNVTNKYGFFSVSLPEGKYTIVFSYVGYNSMDTTFLLDGDKKMSVLLESGTVLEEVLVDSEYDHLENTQMGLVSIPIDQVKLLPRFGGEVDIFKVLQLMPGIKNGGEGSSGLYVRGGGPDQNLILLDGVPVYNASHLFGFFSVFNDDAINNVEVIKGGFPARYGGRLSSVIDMTMKEGNMNKFNVSSTIGLVAAKVTVEGPIKKNKSSFIVSARRTYIDLILKPILGSNAFNYYFYDINAKINYIFSPKNRIYASFYMGRDYFFQEIKSIEYLHSK